MNDARKERLKRLAEPGDYVMKFAETEGRDGFPPRSISFVGVQFEPLGYEDLARARLYLPVTVPLDWRNVRIFETDIDGVDIEKVARGNTTLESVFSSTTVSLQRGGWLPSGLAVTRKGVTILPDRNVITQIKGRFEGDKVVGAGRDFLDMLTGLEVRINPLLYAMEGNNRGIPSPATVEAQLNEAISFVGKALPKAQIVVGSESLNGALGLIEESRPGIGRKQAFLLDLAPKLNPPTSRRWLDVRWAEVLEAADRHGVRRNSLVVLAALSAVAVPNSGSPAKKVLKFRSDYSAAEAYNALADIRSLEILMHLFALLPDERPTIFTRDRPLALFWAGIQAFNFTMNSGTMSFDLSPVEELLPGATLSRWRDDMGGR